MKIPLRTFRHLWARTLALVLMSVTALTAVAQTTAKEALVVYKTDGTKVSYVLETKPTVKFSGATLLIDSPEISDSYDMAQVTEFRFEEETQQPPSGINDAAAERRITVTSESVTISGLEPGAPVSAADMQGRLMAEAQADGTGVAAISIRNFAPGVYVIVTADRHSFKIYKR